MEAVSKEYDALLEEAVRVSNVIGPSRKELELGMRAVNRIAYSREVLAFPYQKRLLRERSPSSSR